MVRKHPENNLQIAVAQYLRLQYPLVLFIHVPNEGNRVRKQNKKGGWYSPEGVRNKQMGVVPGCPDFLIFKPVQHGLVTYHGAAIELKIKPNRPTPEQLNFMNHLKNEGWYTAVCYDMDEAEKIIKMYLK